jgi:hypothetical protein
VIRILSVISNSGSCERPFSDFGITHTKVGNKLTSEKVHKTSVVKMDLQRSHTTAGLTAKRRKRKFGQDDKWIQDETSELRPINSPMHGEDGQSTDVHDLMNSLISDANVDDLDGDPVPTVAVPPSLLGSRTAAQRRIPLASLFSFAELAPTGYLEFYWKGGLSNMEREVTAYELMQEEDSSTGVLADGTVNHASASSESISTMPSLYYWTVAHTST